MFSFRALMWGSTLATIVTVTALTSCTYFVKKIVEKPNVTLTHIGIKDPSADGATVLVDLKIENPNPFSLAVDTVRYTLDVNGKQIASSKIDKGVDVPGKSSAVIEIPVPVQYKDVFSSVLDLLQKGSCNYHVKGEATIGAFTLPFDKSGEFKLKP